MNPRLDRFKPYRGNETAIKLEKTGVEEAAAPFAISEFSIQSRRFCRSIYLHDHVRTEIEQNTQHQIGNRA